MAISCLKGINSLRFPPELRIRSASDFSIAVKVGKKLDSRYFSLYVSENLLNTTRLGLVVSRKVGNSVRRNRIKRLLREAFKHIFPSLACGLDLVIIAKREITESNFYEITKALDEILFFHKNTKGTKG